MTELETMQRAKMYLDKLARGIDPITGRAIPEDSALNNARLARCFCYVSGVLEQVIANGGTVGSSERTVPFSITPEQLARVQLSTEPIRVSQLIDRITAAVSNPRMKKLSATVVTNWLLEKGFLEKQEGADGKTNRVPTRSGLQLGLFSLTRQGQNGEYHAVFYNTDAQRFILDNLSAILEEKSDRQHP